MQLSSVHMRARQAYSSEATGKSVKATGGELTHYKDSVLLFVESLGMRQHTLLVHLHYISSMLAFSTSPILAKIPRITYPACNW